MHALLLVAALAGAPRPVPVARTFAIRPAELRMSDGVVAAATVFEPVREAGERLPTLLELWRHLELDTRFTVRSDAGALHVRFTRRLTEDGRSRAHRIWEETIPRDGQ